MGENKLKYVRLIEVYRAESSKYVRLAIGCATLSAFIIILSRDKNFSILTN